MKELCLANNELTHNDAFHIANVLKNNFFLQLLDISNNNVQDEGFRHIGEALGYQSVHVNKTSSSGDSLSSANKFDFSDLTANLNNINNNRHRFCLTPPPKIQVADDAASSINNNSILQCDNDDRRSESDGSKSEGEVSSKEDANSAAVAMISSNSSEKSEDGSGKDKFKYTAASLSPISHGYDDSTTNHHLFNARSPERSFSSESLCSETSIESNDSKSSIRLIETKFNKNGTLERQSSNIPSMLGVGERQPTGLQVLILWNNNLTSKCSPSAADMFESTEFVQIINFGQNPIGNEFIAEVKSSIKVNKSLISLGLQATQMTCDGLKVLSEAIESGGNSTLQRIDLRNNELSVFGLSTFSEALKSNKNIIRVDLDETSKSAMYENSSEYQRCVKMIRQQCAINENPPEVQENPKATTTVQRMKRNTMSTRKISLTCASVKVTPKQFLDPVKKPANSRLRSPSPIPSPIPSPLPSPSRSRFQVVRVSESSSGVSSKLTSSTSPSPSSSSGSPTFFPSNSRFRVVTVTEAPKKFEVSPIEHDEAVQAKLLESDSKPEPSKEIDIPIMKTSLGDLEKFAPQTAYLNVSNASLLSSQSCEQLDYEVKKFIDMDSCSSFSSSIDSIDHHTDVSSTESFDLIEKPSIFIEPLKIQEEPTKPDGIAEQVLDEDKKDIFSNENTLVSTSSSSSSNEGLTLTTNSPTSDLSPKQDAQKRIRKTSWIKSDNYSQTVDKLLNLFHHPTSIFTKTSPESTLQVMPSSPSCPSGKPKPSQSKDDKLSNMGQKENSFSGFFNSLVSLTHKKDVASNEPSSILQNISPENTVGKISPNSQMVLESLPKSFKLELKENISPENTISSENLAEIERQRVPIISKVLFLVGDGSIDLPDDSADETESTDERSSLELVQSENRPSLGDITRDSMSMFKPDELEESTRLTSDSMDGNQ